MAFQSCLISLAAVSKSWGRETDQIEGPTHKSLFNGIKGPRFGVKPGFRSLIRFVTSYVTPLSIIQTFRMVVTIETITVANTLCLNCVLCSVLRTFYIYSNSFSSLTTIKILYTIIFKIRKLRHRRF